MSGTATSGEAVASGVDVAEGAVPEALACAVPGEVLASLVVEQPASASVETTKTVVTATPSCLGRNNDMLASLCVQMIGNR